MIEKKIEGEIRLNQGASWQDECGIRMHSELRYTLNVNAFWIVFRTRCTLNIGILNPNVFWIQMHPESGLKYFWIQNKCGLKIFLRPNYIWISNTPGFKIHLDWKCIKNHKPLDWKFTRIQDSPGFKIYQNSKYTRIQNTLGFKIHSDSTCTRIQNTLGIKIHSDSKYTRS